MERRLEDRVAALASAGQAEVQGAVDEGSFSAELVGYGSSSVDGLGLDSVFTVTAEDAEPVVLVRATRGNGDVLISGSAVNGSDDAAAARAFSAWRERWFHLWKRGQLPRKLIRFFDDLNVARDSEEISGIVAKHVLEIVGGYRAVVFLPDNEVDSPWNRPGDTATRLSRFRFGQAGLVAAPDFRKIAEPWWSELGSFLGDPQVSMIAHVPFGERGVLLVAERRSDRVFTADDWDVLGTLAEQGDRALTRARLLDEAYELSLTDPLTGLANRRQMEVVLRHAWAAAVRGEGLALMMLDLDGFKAINDTHGHTFGDQVLTIVGECLREEARGADAVVRYGGDEFLVIMPRGTVEGARSLAGRVGKRLDGWVGISAGIAVFHGSYSTVAELLDAADADLYRSKSLRAFAPVRQSAL